MFLEVITPDETLFKGNVSSIVLPGLDGSFGILDSHAPLVSALKKGTVKIEQNLGENKPDIVGDYEGKLNKEHKDDAEFTFEIGGGVIEVKENKVIVLAE
ncbi:MAG: hypothetical protein MI810_10210 [Flavobacteriales bacterium]|nr:hypothetical protein [Flavobacteriales bacterium]